MARTQHSQRRHCCGKATVQRLAADGYPVAICARDVETLDVATADINGVVLAVHSDVTDTDAVEQFVSESVDAVGGIDA